MPFETTEEDPLTIPAFASGSARLNDPNRLPMSGYRVRPIKHRAKHNRKHAKNRRKTK